MAPPKILIYLLRRDLRLADNPVFHDISRLASQSQAPFTHLLPLFIFPAQQIEVSGLLSDPSSKSPFPEARSAVAGFWRCGPHRAKFLAESVWDAKEALEKKKSGLVLRAGMVGPVLKELIEALESKDVGTVEALWMTSEDTTEEKREEREVRKVIEDHGKTFKLWQDEKYFIDDRDLPFPKPRDLPDVFTTYRKSVEPLRSAPRQALPEPKALLPLPSSIPPHPKPFTIPTSLPSLITALQKPLKAAPLISRPPSFPSTTSSAHPFTGGSTAAQARLHHLLLSGSMTSYKDTRNGLLGTDFSTKLSAYLALGSLTARQIHHALMDFEDGKASALETAPGYGLGESKGSAAVRFELLWRDYMHLCARKFGHHLFRQAGFRHDNSYPWKSISPGSEAASILQRWCAGTTGTGLIDASQRELFHTGYTSNRARQNSASYLSKHLGLDWRAGAEWYESMLVDYDVSSNWGNWQYVAGVGNDPRGEARIFNPIKQAFDYDPKGDYVKAWIPDLRDLGPGEEQSVFQPWMMKDERREALGLVGVDWVEKPLKRIEFRLGKVGGRGRKNRERGMRGGYSNGPNGKWGGRGGGERGGGERGRGGGDRGRGGRNGGADRGRQGRMGLMDRAQAQGAV
ncbi:MAG: hypothetical protein M1814_001377 [Vezdaea aestivalis]|nr:MAG: hypothetical protein M1814_001377 [Vezdaea aestivalis]